MTTFKDIVQSADWKTEKHVPVIDCSDAVKKGETVKLAVTVGREISHPNTTEHFIAWIEVFFLPKGEKFPYQLGRFDFTAHGASTQGPNMSTVYTQPSVVCMFKTEKPGTIVALSYCNIHGVWESAKELSMEG